MKTQVAITHGAALVVGFVLGALACQGTSASFSFGGATVEVERKFESLSQAEVEAALLRGLVERCNDFAPASEEAKAANAEREARERLGTGEGTGP